MTKLHPVEGDVKKEIKKILDDYGWFWFMPPANVYSKVGISDFIALKDGHMLCIEVKLKKTEGSTNQEAFLQKIREHGGTAIVVNMDKLHKFRTLIHQWAQPR